MPLVQQLTFVRPTTLGFDDPDELDEVRCADTAAMYPTQARVRTV